MKLLRRFYSYAYSFQPVFAMVSKALLSVPTRVGIP